MLFISNLKDIIYNIWLDIITGEIIDTRMDTPSNLPTDIHQRQGSTAAVDKIVDIPELGEGITEVMVGTRKFRRHTNPDLTIGGFVENTATVDPSVYLGIHTLVYDNAEVHNSVRANGNVHIYGNAKVYGNVQIDENVHVYDYALVADRVRLSGNVRISGSSWITGSAVISGDAKISECAMIYGSVIISGSPIIRGHSNLSGITKIDSDAVIEGITILNRRCDPDK